MTIFYISDMRMQELFKACTSTILRIQKWFKTGTSTSLSMQEWSKTGTITSLNYRNDLVPGTRYQVPV